MTTTFRSDLPDVEIGGTNLVEVVLDACRDHPTRPAVMDGATGQRLTYGQLAHHIDRIGAWFADRGYACGDVVAIWAPNIAPWPAVSIGAMAAGCTVTGISPLATDPEVRYHLVDSGTRVLVCWAPFAARAAALAAETGVGDVIMMGEPVGDTGGYPRGTTGLDDLITHSGASADTGAIVESAIAMVPYSSGTTGLPKGVCLRHDGLVTALRQFTATMRPTCDDVVLALPPFGHIMGSVLTMLLPLSVGGTVVTVARFVPDRFFSSIIEHGVTMLVVPPMLAPLLAHGPELGGVRLIAFGGAPMSGRMQCAVARRHPHVDVVGQGWGMTELAAGATTDRAGHRPRYGSVGRLLPNTELRVIDPETGGDLGAGATGELLVRGPQAMAGYHGNHTATAATVDRDGWVHTGDLGRIDSDGQVWVTDRIKDLIKVRGFQVSPVELETILCSHPSVIDAAVVRGGIAGEEHPVAFVVPGTDFDARVLGDWFREQVAPYKRIDDIRCVDAIPRNPAGKLLRRELVRAVTAVRI
ncbi:AMP-binding protein [Gordonia amarae]|uniref:AMP-binding protein n=2 Tax=Gordonia amarae TaxID=36821 RepID=A0A857KIU7_9ACTN|nr:AMP-binding protein [Gordonia amarae]MCS3878535.1 acyl-CoA synthetase (AMP-forming)/AMP-acid ligase II [Gordonia amarae]QHN17143.1 AMP-binding protein [Gordonia amarae]QHN21669.1 AMP-binding protein [Gordonia amarae]QHN30521.1 AMP-binding protein [Gordonia amarae]QHN39297.1 AMP-binding protein [Gordonia amarae]